MPTPKPMSLKQIIDAFKKHKYKVEECVEFPTEDVVIFTAPENARLTINSIEIDLQMSDIYTYNNDLYIDYWAGDSAIFVAFPLHRIYSLEFSNSKPLEKS